ncbi:MAG: hypothetical protein P8M78_12395 [Myxococcota bacterium]|nr:hypothetical protein [Myxococcota bacterium]
MPTPGRSAPPGRTPPPFRPRFTIGIIYLVAFFLFFSFLQVLPELIHLAETMPPGPDQEEAARRVMQEGLNVLLSVLLSLGATSLGAYYSILPGMRTG